MLRLAERRIAAYKLEVENNSLRAQIEELQEENDILYDRNIELSIEKDRLADSMLGLADRITQLKALHSLVCLQLRALQRVHRLCRSNRPIILYR